MNVPALVGWVAGLFSGSTPDVFGLVKLCLVTNAVLLSICLLLYAVREVLIRAAARGHKSVAMASATVRDENKNRRFDG